MVAPADQLALIDAINGVKPLPIFAGDIDRSGIVNSADILAFVDGFNSGWNGSSLPACPGPTSTILNQQNLANTLSTISNILKQIQASLSDL
jgi:hypothetical protein